MKHTHDHYPLHYGDIKHRKQSLNPDYPTKHAIDRLYERIEKKVKRTATVWGTPDATEEQIRDAHSLHLKLIMPNYRKAEKLAQTYMKNYEDKPTKEELICYLSDNGTPRHEISDLARTVRNMIYRS